MAEVAETIEVKPEDLPGSAGAKARGEPVTAKDIGALVSPSPDPTMDISGVAKDLSGITRREIADRGQLLSGIFGRAHEDQDRARRAFEAEGVGPHDLQPWDAEQERRKYQYDPMEAFGSFGSVFATIASAFTRRPMINALNASAAAMEATRAAKKEDFQNAYQAWRDNNDLVIKRHNMMHQQYQDAISLMDTDLRLGTAKLSALAAQYGDQKTLALLDHGMSKELFEMLDARSRAVERIAENNDKMDERLRKNFDLNQRLRDLVKNGGTKQDIPRIIREWHRDWENVGRSGAGDADQEFIGRWRTEHPHGTSEEFAEAFGEFKKGQHSDRFAADQEFASRYFDAHPNATPEEFSEAFGRWKKGQKFQPGGPGGVGNTNLTTDRQRAADIAAARAKWKAEGKSDAEIADLAAKLEAKLKTTAASVTGNRREQLEGHVAQYDNAVAAIDKVTNVLERYVGAAGIAGRATRTGERIGNIFGNKQTDRVQFMRDVEYIKALAPNLLLDRSGRPLSAEAAHINDIVAGLSAGDTTANTIRAMKDLKVLLRKMQADQRKRIGEEAPESETPAGATPDSGTAKNWYENYQ